MADGDDVIIYADCLPMVSRLVDTFLDFPPHMAFTVLELWGLIDIRGVVFRGPRVWMDITYMG